MELNAAVRNDVLSETTAFHMRYLDRQASKLGPNNTGYIGSKIETSSLGPEQTPQNTASD